MNKFSFEMKLFTNSGQALSVLIFTCSTVRTVQMNANIAGGIRINKINKNIFARNQNLLLLVKQGP